MVVETRVFRGPIKHERLGLLRVDRISRCLSVYRAFNCLAVVDARIARCCVARSIGRSHERFNSGRPSNRLRSAAESRCAQRTKLCAWHPSHPSHHRRSRALDMTSLWAPFFPSHVMITHTPPPTHCTRPRPIRQARGHSHKRGQARRAATGWRRRRWCVWIFEWGWRGTHTDA